jgi:hypothetical protein
MRHVERMNGTGTVTSGGGVQKPVQYDLHVYQEEISAGTSENPNATIPGMKDIRGRVDPVCFSGDRDLTLQMQDGRKLKFFFANCHGTVSFLSWIG